MSGTEKARYVRDLRVRKSEREGGGVNGKF